MTEAQKSDIIKDFNRFIPDVARKEGVFNDDVKNVVKNELTDEDDFIIVPWPEVQELMVREGFHLNSSLANDEWSLEKYGSSAYFVNKQWLSRTE